MSVNLEPQELGFKRPFTHEVSQILRLQNPNSDYVAFKVKTTAPKQYCVRPNSGRIEPGGDVEVQVLLQAMKEDPPPDARCRDKFLVQSVAISADQATGNVTQVWSSIEQTAKSSIQEKKIRVSFLPADGTAAAAAAATSPTATTNGAHDDEHHAYSSPSPPAVTPQRTMGRSDEKNTSHSTASDAAVFGTSSVAASALGSAATAVSNTTGISQEDLKSQLEEAKAQIARLQAQAAEATGLRQRKTESSSGTSAEKVHPASLATKQAPPGGVPIYIVALLCLLTFLIAFFLF